MTKIIDILSRFTAISEPAQLALVETVQTKTYPKGALLLEEGKTCHHLYLLISGCTRGFYFKEGKDVTTWFAFEHDVVTSLYSLVTQQPSFESIQALEDSVLYSISYPLLQKLYRTHPEINTVGRLLTEQYYIALEERILSLQFNSASDRYHRLLRSYPRLLQKASLGHIASYLGITQETLSRIRAKNQAQ